MAIVSKIKCFLPAAIIILSSATAMPSPLVSPGMKRVTKNENKTINQAVMKNEMKAAVAHQAGAQGSSKGGATGDIMIVDAKIVAEDWKQAFNMLKKKQTAGILFNMANGEKITDIISVDSLPGGYLMFFTLKNLHGMEYKIIKTSEIISLSTK